MCVLVLVEAGGGGRMLETYIHVGPIVGLRPVFSVFFSETYDGSKMR